MHSDARCGQRSMTTILMAVTTATLMKIKSSEEAGSIRLEGSASVDPPLTNAPTIVTVLITRKTPFQIRENGEDGKCHLLL